MLPPLGITTAPRPKEAYYLDLTVASAIRTGFREIFVFAEPGSRTDLPRNEGANIEVIQNPARLGNYANFRAVAEFLASSFSEKNSVVTCEDDVVFGADAAKKIDSLVLSLGKNEDFGFLSPYTSSIYQRSIPEGVHPWPSKSLWGACCLAWTPKSLLKIISHPHFQKWRGLDSNKPPIGSPEICHVDTCIGETAIRLGMKTYFMKPCCCDHVGAVSSLRNVKLHPDRRTTYFE